MTLHYGLPLRRMRGRKISRNVNTLCIRYGLLKGAKAHGRKSLLYCTTRWYFSVVDVVNVLADSKDYQTARKYWNKLKERLRKEGSESVTNCHQLKLEASDGKKYKTDVADTEQLFRLIQSIPSPKAEPFKQWAGRRRTVCNADRHYLSHMGRNDSKGI